MSARKNFTNAISETSIALKMLPENLFGDFKKEYFKIVKCVLFLEAFFRKNPYNTFTEKNFEDIHVARITMEKTLEIVNDSKNQRFHSDPSYIIVGKWIENEIKVICLNMETKRAERFIPRTWVHKFLG